MTVSPASGASNIIDSDLSNAVNAMLDGNEVPAPAKPAAAEPAPSRQEAIPDPSDSLPSDLGQPATTTPTPQADESDDAAFQSQIAKFDPKQKEAILHERARNKELRQELKRLQEAASAVSKPDPEAETLRAKLQEVEAKAKTLEEQLGQIDLTRSETFKQEYDHKITGLMNKAVRLLVQEGLTQQESVDILRKASAIAKPSQREEYLSNTLPGAVATVAGMLTQVDDIRENRELALKNWQATQAALSEKDKTSRSARVSSTVEADVSAAIETLKSAGNQFYQQSQKSPEWNAKVAERTNALKGVLLRGDNAEISRLVAAGLTADEYRGLFTAQKAAYDKLVASLNARDRLDLGVRADARGTPPPSKSGIDTTAKSPQDAALKFLES